MGLQAWAAELAGEEGQEVGFGAGGVSDGEGVSVNNAVRVCTWSSMRGLPCMCSAGS